MLIKYLVNIKYIRKVYIDLNLSFNLLDVKIRVLQNFVGVLTPVKEIIERLSEKDNNSWSMELFLTCLLEEFGKLKKLTNSQVNFV